MADYPNNAPVVSVIIPCYNRDAYIKKTINSVIVQTYPHIEILCVDDGSTDRTREILETYKDKIQILEHPERKNKGQSAAINLGLKYSHGEYIAILDSDDLFFPEKIEKQVSFLAKHKEFGLVYSDGYNINAAGEILYNIFPENHIEDNSPVRMLMECHFNLPSNSLVRKSVFDKAGFFDESMRSAQDHDMAIRIMEITQAAYLNMPLWCYRRHSESQSGKHALRRWYTGLRILRNACRRYDYGINIKRKRLAVLYFRIGQCNFEQRAFLKAFYYMCLSGIFDPGRALKVITLKEKITSPH